MGFFVFSTLTIFFAVFIHRIAELQKQVEALRAQLGEKHKMLQTQHTTIIDLNRENQELNADLCEADDEREELQRDLKSNQDARRRLARKLVEVRKAQGLPIRIQLVDSREIAPDKGVKPGFSSLQN